VVERYEPERRGKGYALDAGMQYLRQDPPDVVLVIDADCRLGEGAISTLAGAALSTGRPTQALFRMKTPAESSSKRRVQEFAWILKNYIRPLGLSKLGLPCQLMGSGMAFPWRAISSVDLASGNLVEDVKLGLDLANKGYGPLFCPSASIESTFPISGAATIDQRRRWEIGSARMLLSGGPRYIWRGLTKGNLHLFVLALDVMVPPLSLLAGLIVMLWLVDLAEAASGDGLAPLLVATSAGALSVGLLVLAWARFGRQVLPAKDVWHLTAYLFEKVWIYRWRLDQPMQWVRTDRS
jgi:cellulose synthase/poly-beta-1,6-N-acetylglucosamine synthase-like glycosyltransferase